MTPNDRPAVAVLGTGIMGFAMAARLAAAELPVAVWNRTREKAAPLRDKGASVKDTPAEAVHGADIVITMLLDDVAVLAAMQGDDGALATMSDDAIWIQMSTVGEPGWRKLAALAADHDVAFIDAPVLGTSKPAEDGKLTILASGPTELIEGCQPVWTALGSVLDNVGPAGNGSRLKLAVNSWVLTLTDATAAAISIAQNFGLDGALFLAAIEGTATDSQYAQTKGRSMIAGAFPPAFTVAGAAKDAHLVASAADSLRLDTALIDAVATHFDAAQDAGHGDHDMAAVFVAHAEKPRD